MNSDNLISSFDFEKFTKNCILHNMLRIYFDNKSELSSCDDNEAIMLMKQLEEYSDVLRRLLNHAKCFPDSCDNCEGLTKCIDCIIKDDCLEAQSMFYELMQQTRSF